MKKTIILLILIPKIVLGETIYTEYEIFQTNTNEYLEETDTLKREEVTLYNTYKEELEEKYLSLEDKQSNEYNIDYTDFIYEHKNSLEHNKYSESFQTKCLNEQYTPKSLTISNFNNKFKITEVEVLSKKINGVGVGLTNYKGFMSRIVNGIIDESPIELNNESKISFNFYNDIEIDDLQIKLYLPKQDLNNISFKISFKDGEELTSEININKNEDNIISISFDNDYYKFLEENNFNTTNTCISYYSLKIPLYKHSKLNVIPLNNYLQSDDYNLFLKNDYKIVYNYYKREKIELLDNIIINKEFNIKDFMISSTIPLDNLEVKHNIKYNQDGIYSISIYHKNQLLKTLNIKYVKEEAKQEENQPKIIDQNTASKIKTTKITTTKQVRTTKESKKIHTYIVPRNIKMNTTIVKKMNNQIVTSVKENNFQKPILIASISILLILLIIFESILLYVKKKYY